MTDHLEIAPMNDKFALDIGDFGKLALLRRISRCVKAQLGVHWYYTGNAGDQPKAGNAGDRPITFRYLDNPKTYSNCDEELFNNIFSMVAEGKRSVKAIDESQLLPTHASFLNLMNFPNQAQTAIRQKHWDETLNAAYKALTDAKWIFFDPDDGMICSPRKGFTKKALKNVYKEVLLP